MIELVVNGQSVTVRSHGLARLLDVLRDELGLTGTKEGCGEGECGACSVLVDGRVVNACLLPVGQLREARIETIEGLEGPEREELQRAFVETGATQCGICTPGMIMAARALLNRESSPSAAQVVEGLAGNLCRCTGYAKIVQAVLRAAARRRGEGGA